MKYNIISINDVRENYKTRIRKRVDLEEISLPGIDGNAVDLDEELTKRGLSVAPAWHPTRGELGVWLSTFDNWVWTRDNDEALVVFEDDAIPEREFSKFLSDYISELPDDWHFLSLWVPTNQYYDYLYDVEYDEDGRWTKVGNDRSAAMSIHNFGAMRLARVYQGYGNVATLYSPKGADIMIQHAQVHGITGPIDCWICDRAHTGVTNGFAPKPHWAKAVTYDWRAETTVHNTERI